MIIEDRHFDVIVIGTGAGGATLAAELADGGRSVLVLERGQAIPPEDLRNTGTELFRKERFHPKESWFGTDGDPFPPQMLYGLGGNTKIWGGVLERMREREFGSLRLQKGSTPAWELTYADFAPYYDRAEQRYQVHGKAGVDPTEPARQADYGFAPRPIEPVMEELRAALTRQGIGSYDLPLSWSDSKTSPCGDADQFGVAAAQANAAITIRTGARVRQLHTNPSGNQVKAVEAEIDGDRWLFRSHLVVLAAGAINTPALLLRSADGRHPHGLANGSDQVGRNLMKPQLTSILQLAARPGRGHDARSLGINDFYWGDQNVDFPLGHIQSGGGVLQDALFAESPPVLSLVSKLMPDFGLEQLAGRSITWWAMTAVAPDPHNRISLRGDQVQIHYEANNLEAHDRLVYRWIDCLKAIESDPLTQVVKAAPTHPRGQAPLSVLGLALGTCRMGSNPATSVVNLQGQCHEVNNLFIADASVMPSCPSVGIGLTVIANAIRIADHLKELL